MIFSTALLTVWLIYSVVIIRYVRKQLTTGLLDITDENKEMAQKFDCFARKDIPKWNHFEMYFVAVFLLPLRLLHFILSTALCTLFVKIALIGTHHTKELSVLRRYIIKAVCQILARSCLYSFGFYTIDHVRLEITSIDPTYPRLQLLKNKGKEAPIIVSNHISWVDIFLYMTSLECPSYMAKHEVERYPLVGPIAQGLQCLFVERESKDKRGDIVTQLSDRIDNFEKNPVAVPQVMVFPEGTTSNGEYILSFKKGAFANFTPVKIYALKYTNKRYSPALDSLGIGRSLLFTLLQLKNNVTIYDLGVFYPDYLNLKSEDQWPIYAQKIKNIMVKVLDMKPADMGFADKTGYYKTLLPKKVK